MIQQGIDATVINPLFITGLDEELFSKLKVLNFGLFSASGVTVKVASKLAEAAGGDAVRFGQSVAAFAYGRGGGLSMSHLPRFGDQIITAQTAVQGIKGIWTGERI
ncbi:MAG: hypothetical protein II137_07230 [Anaerovibrio sp.]|nr:hypothetical protein [Anaerovibrio sp.]